MINFILGWMMYFSFPVSYSLVHHEYAMEYLGNNPFNIKLNTELSVFFVNLFKWSTAYTPEHVDILNIGFLLGFDFGLIFIVELLFLIYVGHYLFYIVMARIYRLFVTALYSLSLLFRSKRYNILKNRTETQFFETDQLVLGTIIFVPFLQAFPTVLVFYLYSVYVLFEFLFLQLSATFLISLLKTQFECKEEIGEVVFFSCYPSISMIKRHFVRSVNSMEIELIKFSLYNKKESITLHEFLRGIPVRLKRTNVY
eukprot:NODE_137_length_18042_cov_0.768823.p7 type:complete len:255 gc:universal NODE_137_length_18042_cov_0.768823:16079-15315(-)